MPGSTIVARYNIVVLYPKEAQEPGHVPTVAQQPKFGQTQTRVVYPITQSRNSISQSRNSISQTRNSLGSNSSHYGSVLRLPSSSPRTRGIDILAWNGSALIWCKASPKDVELGAHGDTEMGNKLDAQRTTFRLSIGGMARCSPSLRPLPTSNRHGYGSRPASCSASSRTPLTLADAFACPWCNSEPPSDVPVYRGILSSGMGRTGESARPFPTLVPHVHVYASKWLSTAITPPHDSYIPPYDANRPSRV
ncbi:hypothetical protein DFP72DRAFT_1176482 [Ephemerocybe angulata]|uniref:Uncharacterized protein n=1 Tax=Ephemerocybe angulata TaxID=980116 RepID=A0A8H6HDM7_9AGAR|nr:hypothetical protein DFP72DRAFT_1176482 [Tulosesus angulatus]